ncbi:unnamed protein product [Paramecium sonneborni]|uniref:Uncharacterized protein n=1 Tax=Paramecium sonneborni TaxID=65129 RepID=A0A8S1RQ33_9CILI|nr:unnamed protein product [Paramecium sonneborni]
MMAIYQCFCQIIVNKEEKCKCSDLIFENECDDYGICQFIDGKCSDTPCKIYENVNRCLQNPNCSWSNQQCKNFQSCLYFNVTTSIECSQLGHNCSFNDTTKICNEQQPCLQFNFQDCILMSFQQKRFCYWQEDQCQELTDCKEITKSNYFCKNFEPICKGYDETMKNNDPCEQAYTCEQLNQTYCRFAYPELNGDQLALCDQGAKLGECVDFNPQTYKQKDCFVKSQGFYHWIGNECQKCGIMNLSFLLTLTINIFILTL